MTRKSSRRRRWLIARHRAGQHRPNPVTTRVGSVDGATTGPTHAAAIYTRLLTRTRGLTPRSRRRHRDQLVIVAATEASEVHAQDIADQVAPGQWRCVQLGRPGSAEAALVLAVRWARVQIIDVDHTLVTPATSAGGGIRARYVLRVRVVIDPGTPHEWETTINVVHAHPSRAARERDQYLADTAGLPGVTLGDPNLPRVELERRYAGRRVHNAGVIAAAVPAWIPSAARPMPRRRLARSDHDALDTTLWPPASRPKEHS